MTCARSVGIWLLALFISAAAAQAARPVRELQGDEQFGQGNYKLARALYREALRADPRSDRIWAKYDLTYLREMSAEAGVQTATAAVTVAANATASAMMTRAAVEPMLGPAVTQELAQAPAARRPLMSVFDAVRGSAPLGAPVAPIGPMAMATPRRDQPLEPELDRELPPEPETMVPPPLPRVPGQVVPHGNPTTPSGVAEAAARAQGLQSQNPVPGTPSANSAPSATTQLAPSEVISVASVQPGDALAPSVGARGEPLVVRGVGWDIWDLRYGVDLAGRPHVVGKLRNLAGTDLVNPSIYVGLVDAAGVQVAFKPVKLVDAAGVLFPGASGEFDAEFPTTTSPVAGYRLFVLPQTR